MKNKNIINLALIAVFCTITVIAVTWSNQIDWPDNVYIDYGFPFVWATQTTSTIVGAVNIWAVDIAALSMNLVLWLALIVISSIALLLLIKEKN